MQETVKSTRSDLGIGEALSKTRSFLLSLRNAEGIWTGELSASALATATAIVALEMMRRQQPSASPLLTQHIEHGRDWLSSHANEDGGCGDTVQSKSNISTTTLVWAALKCGGGGAECGTKTPGLSALQSEAAARAEKWLVAEAGSLDPEQLAAKILERYGSDRTFSAPILTHCAAAGRLGTGPQAWRHVIPLPFELAACPAEWFGALRLPVVSYALPALIAIGYVRHYQAPSRNPFLRLVRSLVTERVFRVLDSVQPSNGGFLEAIPLTSFVVMSLAASGRADHAVARRGLEFILNSVQPDGSWKIDTNLSTFVTTLATHALASDLPVLATEERGSIQGWLLRQQYRVRHAYTNAAPGGWAWTPLPGGVPDADDTAGALVALKALQMPSLAVAQAATEGIAWLLNLQNRDGGIPTFCRGWGKLLFDRSSADISAHALRAWAAWENDLPQSLRKRIQSARLRAVRFLRHTQESAGSWSPLWFGNQFESDESNRVYGTSRVVLALAETNLASECVKGGVRWLTSVQRPDGGWSGGSGSGGSTTEETALALESLCAVWEFSQGDRTELEHSIRRGLENLLGLVADGTWTNPSPIGFYFAKLWYFEKLYPVIFTVAALQRARRFVSAAGTSNLANRRR